MKLLCWSARRSGRTHRLALFGSGLIGGAVAEAVRRRTGSATVTELPYDWQDATARQAQSGRIAAALTGDLADDPSSRIDVVWAAGRSGFGSDDAAMADETRLFEDVLALARRVAARLPEAGHTHHLLSSAGGLFEGRTFCDADTAPDPQRPYGFGKLRQEQALTAGNGAARRRIYRPSSVYGFRPGARLGLISALISNALQGRTTHISGRPDTIRDYVFAEDLGQFIALQVMDPTPEAQATFLLASGRPAPMFEVINRIEDILQVPLLVRYDTAPDNARNMSFRPSALDPRWRPTDLETGIRFTANRIQATFLRAGSTVDAL